jgi:hypothetical protein
MTILHSALTAELARLRQQDLIRAATEAAVEPSIRWIHPKRRQRSGLVGTSTAEGST